MTSPTPESLNIQINEALTDPWIFEHSGFLYIIGGLNSLMSPNKDIIEVDLTTKTTQKIFSFAESRFYIGCCMHGDSIYVAGGRVNRMGKREEIKDVECFNVVEKRLVKLPNLNKPRYSVAAVVHKEHLYVFSENSTMDCEKLALDGGKEFAMLSIKFSVSAGCGMISQGDRIYMLNNWTIGAMDENGKYEQCYRVDEPTEETWSSSFQPMCSGDILYFISNEHIFAYDISKKCHEIIDYHILVD